ncbi:hypothetical protein C8Q76DRAFT_797147 [Earliella scabrosa]|nr:hypothetical protein C8Q76DRAFT_797147 [Earliella scabrosa]
MVEPIVLYDIARNGASPEATAWAPSPWRARYCLNIKRIPYRTIWVELPDIAALYAQLGVAPRPDFDGNRPGPRFTLPIIHDPNTQRTVADSRAIVRYLDETYPTHGPVLLPAGTAALHAAFEHAFFDAAACRLPAAMMSATYAGLNPASQAYFKETREAWFGSLDAADHGEAWAGVKAGFHVVAGWLDAEAEGAPFFGGEGIVFADVTVAAFLRCLQAVFGAESAEWRDVLEWDGGRWARLMEAFGKYGAVDEGSKWVM